MRTPKRLMWHLIDHYSVAYTKEGGAKFPTYTLTHEDVPCNVQDAKTEIVTTYKQRDEKCKQSCFLLDECVFNSINVSDRIEFKGLNYRVVGKTDMCNLGKVFRIDLAEEVK